MTRSARIAWGAALLALALTVTAIVVSTIDGNRLDARQDAFIWSIVVVFTVTGHVIAMRHPDNAIGWLFLGIGASAAVGALAGAYARYWVATGAGSELLGLTAASYGSLSWIPFILLPPTFLLLLFPDGHLLSARWRPVASIAGAGLILVVVAQVLRPGPLEDYPDTDNPLGVDTALVEALEPLAFLVVLTAIVGAVASTILRFRRARGEQRQQMKWIAFAGAVAAATLATMIPLYEAVGEVTANSSMMLGIMTVPAATAVAILRYRLYDIDLVINKSMVFVALAGFITAVYAGIVVGLGRLLPVGDGNLGLAIAATAVVAVAFEPVRHRVQHWANRLVYGRRATPYEALAAMTSRIGDTEAPGSALDEAAQLLADGTGAAQTVVWVAQDGMLVPRATAGDRTDPPAPIAPDAAEHTQPDGFLLQAVRHEGRLVGALSLAKRPGEGASSADRRLLEEMAGQAALLLANTRLRSRLSERLDELRTSRQRMIVAQDRARHTLERDLHDGAQQELVALKVKLGLARTVATREGAPELADRLADAADIADRAVDTLRDVARGIYPPLLESEGLAAALTAQARRGDLAVTVLDRTDTRFAREIEATAYFCVREALRNAAAHADVEHAHVELDETDGGLAVVVTDDGAGFDPDRTPPGDGLTHLHDRADAVGGTLLVASRPGHGTTLTLTLPQR